MPEQIEPIDQEVIEEQHEDAAAQLEKMREALKKANREAALSRKRLAELETAEESRKKDEMSELERIRAEKEAAEKRAVDAEERAQQTLIRAAFVAEAAKQGALYPEDVYALADKSGVEVLDDLTVTGVSVAVKALVDTGRVPLAGKASAPRLDAGAGGQDRPSAGQPKLTALELEMAKHMNLSPEAYLKQKAAIAAARSE